jgi:hypothetical protein
MARRDPNDIVQVNLRIAEHLRRRLEVVASSHGVSLNAEMALRLASTLERPGLTSRVRFQMNTERLLGSMEQKMQLLHKAMDEQEKTDALVSAVDELVALIQPLGDSAGSPVRAAIEEAISRVDAAKDAIDQYRNLPVEASS